MQKIMSMPGNKNKLLLLPISLMLFGVLSYATKYYFNLLLTHSLPSGIYSNLVAALKAFLLAAALIPLGTGAASKRFLAPLVRANETENASAYIRWTLHTLLFSSVFFLFILTLIIGFLDLFNLFDFRLINTNHLILYTLFLAPLGGLAGLITAYIQSLNHNLISNLLSQMGLYLLALITLIITNQLNWVYNYPTIWLGFLIVVTFLNLISIISLLLILPHNLIKNTLIFGKVVCKNKHVWRSTSTKLILNQIIYQTTITVDFYAAKFIVPVSARVDQYAVSIVISGIIFLLSINISSFLIPIISSHINKQIIINQETLQNKINASNKINFITSSALLIILVVFGHALLKSFGITYDNATSYTTLIILLIGYYMGTFCKPANSILTYSGHENILILIATSELIIITITSVIGTYFFGIIGTAIACSLTITLKSLAQIIIVHKKLGIRSASIY